MSIDGAVDKKNVKNVGGGARVITIALFFFATAVVSFLTFFFDARLSRVSVVQSVDFEEFDYSAENLLPDNAVFRFDDDGGFENDLSLLESDVLKHEYVVDVKSGHFWVNTRGSDARINLLFDRVVLIPDRAVFDFSFDGNKAVLNVVDGDVYVGFVYTDSLSSDIVRGKYDSDFMNKFIVPKGMQITIPLSKVDDRVEKLFYSKLIKEFRYVMVPSSFFDAPWFFKNSGLDASFHEALKQGVQADFASSSHVKSDGFFSSLFYFSEEYLTFIPSKRHDLIFKNLFSYLDNSIYGALSGDNSKSVRDLTAFWSHYDSLGSDYKNSDEFWEMYDERLYSLSIFRPVDVQYSIYLSLLNNKFEHGRDVFEVVSLLWHDVYSSLGDSRVIFEKSLVRYYDSYRYLVGKEFDPLLYSDYIVYNNRLFGNLLLKTDYLYYDRFFAVKSAMEKELLRLTVDGERKDDLRRQLISNKIDYLKRLMTFFFEDSIDVIEAKKIVSRLVTEIDDLMPTDTSQVAVLKVFRARLESVADFWGYLGSPEYQISSTYGNTNKERFDSYLKDKDVVLSFIDVQRDILGDDDVEKRSLNDVRGDIKTVFLAIENMTDIKVLDLSGVDQRFVKVSGVIAGYSFSGDYDRYNGALNNLVTFGEQISDRPVTLNKLLDLLIAKFADVSVPSVTTSSATSSVYSEETFAQRSARVYIVNLFKKYGFDLTLDNVVVVDNDSAIYRLRDVKLHDSDRVVLGFDFVINGEVVNSLFLSVDGKPVVVQGRFTLEQLQNLALADGDMSVLDIPSDSSITATNGGSVTSAFVESVTATNDATDDAQSLNTDSSISAPEGILR